MHGYIIAILEDFVTDHYAYAYASTFGDSTTKHDATRVYPDELFDSYMKKLAEHTLLPHDQTLRRFGDYTGRALLERYKDRMASNLSLFEVLKAVEHRFHSVFRERDRAAPPMLQPFKVSDNRLIIDYESSRRMADYAIGIIEGMAGYLHEAIDVLCTTTRDGERVEIYVIKA